MTIILLQIPLIFLTLSLISPQHVIGREVCPLYGHVDEGLRVREYPCHLDLVEERGSSAVGHY